MPQVYAETLYPKSSGMNVGIFLDSQKKPIQQNLELASLNGFEYTVGLLGSTELTLSGSNHLEFTDVTTTKTYSNFLQKEVYLKGKKALVISNAGSSYITGSTSSRLTQMLFQEGLEIIIDTGATNLEKIKQHNPDFIVCDRSAWSCNEAIYNIAYDNKFKILTIGNDTTSGIYPIKTGTSTNVMPGSIVPQNLIHFISRGWTSVQNSGNDNRGIITEIHPKAITIAKDATLASSEAIYLEESGKGKWFHMQFLYGPDPVMLERAPVWMLRE